MDTKIILELIKKDINELQLLTEAITKNSDTDNILLEVSIGRTQTVLSQFELLKSMLGKCKPDTELVDETKIETAAEIAIIIEPENKPEEVISTHNNETELSANSPAELSENITRNYVQETKSPKNEIKEGLMTETLETPVKEEHIEASPVNEQKTESITTVTEVKEEKKVEYKKENSEDSNNYIDEKKTQVFGEQFTKEPSLNERFTDLKKTRAALIGHPVHSLKKAIGLNDRFMYTRELFENNAAIFDKTIDALDKAENIIEAVKYLENNFKWKKNDASLKFMELVKRRHGNTVAN